jgi:general secretion pathway protein L
MADGRLAQDPMSVLRIRSPLPDSPLRWEWALVENGALPLAGEGPIAQLPPQWQKRAERIQLLIPAAQVLIARVRLPSAVKRRSGSLLAYAVEDSTASEPDANEVSWLGSAGGADVLAVMDRKHLEGWREALGAAGIRDYSVSCESLMLPLPAEGWSCVWDGREGFVRAGEFEGAATDCGDRQSPPLSLCLMLEDAKARNETPAAIELHASAPEALPDIESWQRALGVVVRAAQRWDWRMAPPEAGVSLVQERHAWRVPSGMFARLRPAAWIAGIALAIHAAALIVDWARMAGEQRTLRTQMESRFRSVFPEAVAVTDPALQMRRKLAEVRRAANKPDEGDFAVMIAKVAGALKVLPAGALHVVSYESGRMTLEFAADDQALQGRISAHLTQSGLAVSIVPAVGTGRRTVTMTVRAL